jgi:hypothetical protein
MNHTIARISAVSKKSGTKKDGNAWTRYGVCADDTWYNTFDTKLGKLAEENKGEVAVITFSETDFGHELEGLKFDAEQPDTEEASPEEIEAIIAKEKELTTKDDKDALRITRVAIWKSLLEGGVLTNYADLDSVNTVQLASIVDDVVEHCML